MGSTNADHQPKAIQLQFALPGTTIVLGFTGSLGSGCTEIAKGVAEHQHFLYWSLSQPLREALLEDGVNDPSIAQMQARGNEMRRIEGPDILAEKALQFADDRCRQDPNKYNGIVLDGIRNIGEVNTLRSFPNFFLFSVQADTDERYRRLNKNGRVKSRDEFDRIDQRDFKESLAYGQQVQECNYAADAIINNDEEIPSKATLEKANYIRVKFVNKYMSLIQGLIGSGPTYENNPSLGEVFMTMAYCESRFSKCLKRKVGAVIAQIETEREVGHIVSSGHNDVPKGQKPCVFASDLDGCARDKSSEGTAKSVNNCPFCGFEIKKSFTCAYCSSSLTEFRKTCPSCGQDPAIQCFCQNTNCRSAKEHIDLYAYLLSIGGGKLLDICRSIHAEQNAIMRLGKIRTIQGRIVLYTTTFPCSVCANIIAESGITEVVYAEPYTMKMAKEILEKADIKLKRFEGVKSSAFFRLYR